MKGYNEYKDVELPWLKKIPVSWKLLRNKNVFEEKKELVGNRQKEFDLLSLTKKGIIIRDISSGKGKFPKDFETYKVVQSGDIIFCFFDVDETPRTVGLSKYNGMITGAYNVFDICNVVPEYVLYYNMAIDNIKGYKPLYSGLRKVIPLQAFFATKMPVPSKPEQDKIVQFLDWKISEMNHFIHQKKKQIKLLEELKYTQIGQYITKGLNPSVSMKDSKVEWIGEIPEHWEVIPAKRLFLEKKETRYESDEPCTASQKYGIISQKEYMLRENSRVVIAEQGLESWKHVSKDDFVISLRSFQGGIERSEVEGCVTWHYIVLRPNKEVNPNYYKWLLKSKSYITALRTTSEFIRDGQDLRYSNFIKVPLLKIPYREQQEIAEYLEELSIKINEMISGINKEITLVEELRTKLISDVVTGQVDVRDVKIPIYEAETDIIDSEEDSDEENQDESMEE